MATASRQRVFPLHLTPIERFLLADDRPRYPMAFVIDLTLTGTLDRQAFQTALVKAVERHPLLIAFVRPAKQQSRCWVSAQGQLPVVDWGEEDVPVTLANGEWIDLRNEVGLRIWIRQGPERVQLITQFHHACCDGIGAYRFLGDLLAIYGARTAVEEPHPTMFAIKSSRLRGRADGCRHLDASDPAGRQIRASLTHLYRIMGRSCTVLHPPQPSRATTEFPGYHSFTFNQSEFKQLRDTARQQGTMLNDLLILELFHTMDQWNSTKRRRMSGNRYRIMMPIDLRDTRDYETPATNIIGYSFLTRKTSELGNAQQLATGIHEETALIRHAHLGEQFVDMISAGADVRGLLPLVLSLPRTMSTAILSNVGDPTRRFLAKFPRQAGCIVAGNLILERISGFPPLRSRTRAAFSIVTYRRQLTIGLRCDPHLFTLDDMQEMLSLYVEKLSQHLKKAG